MRFFLNLLMPPTISYGRDDRVRGLCLPNVGSIKLIFQIVDVRLKAIQVVLSLTAGAYQTSLISYFTHRDLFPALVKVFLLLCLFVFPFVGDASARSPSLGDFPIKMMVLSRLPQPFLMPK